MAIGLLSSGCTALLGLDDKEYRDGAGEAGGGGGGGAGGAGDCSARAPADGSPGQTLWATTISTTAPSSLGGVTVDACGRIWLAGSFTETLTIPGCMPLMSKSFSPEPFLARLRPDGTCADAQAYPGTVTVVVRGIAPVGDGVVLVGRFRGELSITEPALLAPGSEDAFVVHVPLKEPPFGWSFGGGRVESAVDVALDTDGAVVVAGTYTMGFTLGGWPLPEIGLSDIMLFKVDATGAIPWAHGFGSPGDDRITGVAISPLTRRIGITGQLGGQVMHPLLNVGAQDTSLFAAVLGPDAMDGELAIADSSTGLSEGLDVAFDSSGAGLLIGGKFANNFNLPSLPSELTTLGGSDDGLLLRVEQGAATTFGQLGQLVMSGAGNDSISAIAADQDAGASVFAAGRCEHESLFMGANTCPEGHGIFIAKVPEGVAPSPTPEDFWVKTYGDGLDDAASAIALDRMTGEVVVGGTFEGNVDFGNGIMLSNNMASIFILKLHR
jgi:hypothetical protein